MKGGRLDMEVTGIGLESGDGEAPLLGVSKTKMELLPQGPVPPSRKKQHAYRIGISGTLPVCRERGD